ncbi:hypothetical protein AB0R01_30550 [Streptomyces rochei]|uniref:hypothetical protein n=1 Tax=Streptomyces rochei TaxID=1928 RepID=UPI00342AB493
MGAKLVATVHVRDPRTHQMVQLDAGTEPEPELAALVRNPDAWEDGKAPTESKATSDQDDDAEDNKPAAKRSARKPARGRNAADEGSSGD